MAATPEARPRSDDPGLWSYVPSKGSMSEFVARVGGAAPHSLVALERNGLPAAFVNDMRSEMGLSLARMSEIFKIPLSTLSKNLRSKNLVNGREGLAILRLVKLLAKAQRMMDYNNREDGGEFDTVSWFGWWIDKPVPALSGLRPSDLMDTEAGTEMIHQIFSAIEYGVYL